MSARPARSCWPYVLLGTVALAALSGCTTLGTNVKGSFSCAAPDGICAPSSSIDDRALAMISGDTGSAGAVPAGPYIEPRPRAKGSRTVAVGQGLPLGRADPRRTQERVLRIVFQPYIDERGRLHEATAVHAVVQTGDWKQALIASSTALPDRNARASLDVPVSLADAVEGADHGDIQTAGIDPNLPDPAAVAAARARIDPVDAIKADVAARLAAKSRRTATTRTTPAMKLRESAPQVGAAAPGAPRLPAAPQNASVVKSAGTATAVKPPLPTTKSGDAAIARVKASPEYATRSAEAEEAARRAASGGPVPEIKPVQKATVRATGFPAAVPEDK